MLRIPNLIAGSFFLMAVLAGFARAPLHVAVCFVLACAFEWGGWRFYDLLAAMGYLLTIPGTWLEATAGKEADRLRGTGP